MQRCMYIQKSVSEHARNAVLGVEKYKHFLGGIPRDPPAIAYDTTTICHLSTLSI
jgi:hypothetical protein